MNSNNNNNKQTKAKKVNKPNNKYLNPFRMNISDDIYEPFEDLFGFENKMFSSFQNVFKDLDLLTEKPKEIEKEEIPEKVEKMEEEPKEEEINTNTNMEEENEEHKEEEEINKEEPKIEEINTNIEKEPKEEKKEEKEPEKKLNEGTFYSKVYYSSYNNLNGKPNKECYQSQSIKQINNGHNISETKESYKNSDGIEKTAYQRGLDDKTTRFIKEKNIKTGKKNQKKIIKGLEENELNDFNKTYNDICKQCGFKKQFKEFDPFGINRKHLLSDGMNNLFFHKLLF